MVIASKIIGWPFAAMSTLTRQKRRATARSRVKHLDAIEHLLDESPPDVRTTTMFSSLVSAKLNVLIGNDSSCVASTIAAADAWMTQYGPVGNHVEAASLAWKVGEPLHRLMDNYNNGMLCAPHRD